MGSFDLPFAIFIFYAEARHSAGHVIFFLDYPRENYFSEWPFYQLLNYRSIHIEFECFLRYHLSYFLLYFTEASFYNLLILCIGDISNSTTEGSLIGRAIS